jgi:hypothetical protein
VSRHLGHENIQITADTYTDVDRTSFAAAADVMGQTARLAKIRYPLAGSRAGR